MKKITFAVVALFATVLFACQQNSAPEGGYEITATIEGASGQAVLARPEGRQLAGMDTVEVSEGKFKFVGKAEKEEFVVVQLGEGMQAKYVSFYLENEKINIDGKLADIQNAVITGGPNNKVWTEFSKMNIDFQKAGADLAQKFREAQDEDAKKLIEEEYKSSEKVFTDKLVTLIKENNKAVAGVFIAKEVLRNRIDFEGLKTIAESIDPSLAENEMVKELKKQVETLSQVQVGKMAPDFTMNDIEGNPIKLSSLIGKGYLLIDFWAGWCKPCRAENPNVVEAYNKFNAKGFDILGVSFDKEKQMWTDAVTKDQLAWTQVSDLKFWENAAGKIYGVKSIPHNVLLDKEGKIIAKDLRGKDLHTKLAELLGE